LKAEANVVSLEDFTSLFSADGINYKSIMETQNMG